MDDYLKSCCFSGHRNMKFDKDNSFMAALLHEALRASIKMTIREGITTFYTGMARGFDIVAAEALINIRAELAAKAKLDVNAKPKSSILLKALIPYKGQEDNWPDEWRERYRRVLSRCDDIIVLNRRFTRSSYHERNRLMVDYCRRVIVAYQGRPGGTRYTYEYAQLRSKEIMNLCNHLDSSIPIVEKPVQITLSEISATITETTSKEKYKLKQPQGRQLLKTRHCHPQRQASRKPRLSDPTIPKKLLERLSYHTEETA